MVIIAKKIPKNRISNLELQKRINGLVDQYGKTHVERTLNVSRSTLNKYLRGQLPKSEKRKAEVAPKINRAYNRNKEKIQKTVEEKAKTETEKIVQKRQKRAPKKEQWNITNIYPEYIQAHDLNLYVDSIRLFELHDRGYKITWFGLPGEIPLEVTFFDPENNINLSKEPTLFLHLIGVMTGNPYTKNNQEDYDFIVHKRIKQRFAFRFREKNSLYERKKAAEEFFFDIKFKPGQAPLKFLGWFLHEGR